MLRVPFDKIKIDQSFVRGASDPDSRNAALIIVPAWWKALWYLDRLSPAISTQAARLTLNRLHATESAAP